MQLYKENEPKVTTGKTKWEMDETGSESCPVARFLKLASTYGVLFFFFSGRLVLGNECNCKLR